MLGVHLTRRFIQWQLMNYHIKRPSQYSSVGIPKRAQSSGKKNKRKKDRCRRKPKLVSLGEAHRFIKCCFLAVKTPRSSAKAMADLLVGADYRGHQNHGMNRLPMYLQAIEKKVINHCAIPCVIQQTPATAWVNGNRGLGAVIGNCCMDLAIKKARNVGVGWVCVRGATNLGMAGWYTERAMRAGLVGITMSNTLTVTAPTRSKVTRLGSNPISVGACANKDYFLLDMATTAAAVRKIESNMRSGKEIPKGWAQDGQGRETTDAEKGYSAGCLLHLGGLEANSGYKGYGLSAMVDMLTGVMSGANYANVAPPCASQAKVKEYNLGQVFIALDPNCFSPDFKPRLKDFLQRLRSSKPIDPSKPVMVAGDREKCCMKAINKSGGIQYMEDQLRTCAAIAKRLKIRPLKFIKK